MTAPPPGPHWQGQRGQQDPYGPPPHGLPQPPYGPPPYSYGPPKKSNTGLVVALVIVSVLLVAGAGAAIWYLTSRPDAQTGPMRPTAPTGAPPTDAPPREAQAMARDHAKEYVAAINARDEAAATALTCSLERPGQVYDEGVERGPARLGSKPVSMSKLTMEYSVEFESGEPALIELRWPQNGSGSWCIG
ncbi:hypothetical protein ALI22I_08310 [Saccharothrix sp. ALI-22-I]|uniref:hypothetical protein n=1 Tax=Saccharothrix sp. ALI-22-I TaxID=1933778 RepID=UPI00097CB5A4|nr:hypothetical protein [Saccharothrix sp. ALI-22-I]ONI91605.1 hypothetical protein ALI22I_08310 [Saccharothrix sp. ALI-22-I]